MTRIDHVAKANSLLRSVASEPMTSAEATVSMMAAQIHATLALVEQQRIANLIALANSPSPVLNTHEFRPDIAAALGIAS